MNNLIISNSGSVFCELRSKSSELHSSKIEDQKINFQTGLSSWTPQFNRSKINADQWVWWDQRSKIKRSLFEKITDQQGIKDQSSQIKQIKTSNNIFFSNNFQWNRKENVLSKQKATRFYFVLRCLFLKQNRAKTTLK